jgi:hypothetical protein
MKPASASSTVPFGRFFAGALAAYCGRWADQPKWVDAR